MDLFILSSHFLYKESEKYKDNDNQKNRILYAQINALKFYCVCKKEILYLPFQNFS